MLFGSLPQIYLPCLDGYNECISSFRKVEGDHDGDLYLWIEMCLIIIFWGMTHLKKKWFMLPYKQLLFKCSCTFKKLTFSSSYRCLEVWMHTDIVATSWVSAVDYTFYLRALIFVLLLAGGIWYFQEEVSYGKHTQKIFHSSWYQHGPSLNAILVLGTDLQNSTVLLG